MHEERSFEVLARVGWTGGEATGIARVAIVPGVVRTLKVELPGVSVEARLEDGVASGRVSLEGVEREPVRAVEVERVELQLQDGAYDGTRVVFAVIDATAKTRLVAAERVEILLLRPEPAALLAEPEDPPAELDEQAFTELFVELVAARRPDAKLTVPAPLTVRMEPGDSTFHLDNVWKSRPRGQRALAKALIRHAGLCLQQDGGGAAEQLVPVLRRVDSGSPLGAQVATRPFHGDLVVVYVFDHPETIRYATRTEVEALGLDPDALYALALANLARLLPRVERHGRPEGFMLVCGGTYEASAVLLPDLLPAAGDDLSVFVAARDLVLVAPFDAPDARANHAEIAARVVREGSYAISATELRWRAGEWSVAPPRPERTAAAPAGTSAKPTSLRFWPLPSWLALLVLFGTLGGPAHVFAKVAGIGFWGWAVTLLPGIVAWRAWVRQDDVHGDALRRTLTVRNAALWVHLAAMALAVALLAAGAAPGVTKPVASMVLQALASALCAVSELVATREARAALPAR